MWWPSVPARSTAWRRLARGISESDAARGAVGQELRRVRYDRSATLRPRDHHPQPSGRSRHMLERARRRGHDGFPDRSHAGPRKDRLDASRPSSVDGASPWQPAPDVPGSTRWRSPASVSASCAVASVLASPPSLSVQTRTRHRCMSRWPTRPLRSAPHRLQKAICVRTTTSMRRSPPAPTRSTRATGFGRKRRLQSRENHGRAEGR